ncbi:hypothetical protein MRX96_029668 [Rhipicephalus microplus]
MPYQSQSDEKRRFGASGRQRDPRPHVWPVARLSQAFITVTRTVSSGLSDAVETACHSRTASEHQRTRGSDQERIRKAKEECPTRVEYRLPPVSTERLQSDGNKERAVVAAFGRPTIAVCGPEGDRASLS